MQICQTHCELIVCHTINKNKILCNWVWKRSIFERKCGLSIWLMKYFQSQIKLFHLCIRFGIATEPNKWFGFLLVCCVCGVCVCVGGLFLVFFVCFLWVFLLFPFPYHTARRRWVHRGWLFLLGDIYQGFTLLGVVDSTSENDDFWRPNWQQMETSISYNHLHTTWDGSRWCVNFSLLIFGPVLPLHKFWGRLGSIPLHCYLTLFATVP